MSIKQAIQPLRNGMTRYLINYYSFFNCSAVSRVQKFANFNFFNKPSIFNFNNSSTKNPAAAFPKIRGVQISSFKPYTLNLNSTTSPSCITYSFPSNLINPLSFAPTSPPALTKSCQLITSAQINPRSKSV